MGIKFDPSQFQIGQSLQAMSKPIIQEEINLYAKASRDFNPIHIDEEFAKKTPLGGTIAHGMLVLAYVSQMMANNFGKAWLNGGSLNVRFKAPARPGDILSIQSTIRKIQKEPERTVISCDVLCANQKNETVISGEALVRIKNEDIS
jgi:3-hydroxybutyryl-CoA dehydratase